MENLAIIRFAEEAKAYQAFSELKTLLDAGAFNVHEAAVVVAGPSGALDVKDSIGFDKNEGSSTGSLIGLLVGILGGPFGILLGWLAGSALGSTVDAAREAGAVTALSWVGRAIPPGGTGVIAMLGEPTTDALDAMVARLGGNVQRFSADVVHNELESAHQADLAARAAAEKSMADARAKARQAKWDEVKVKAKGIFAKHGGAGTGSTGSAT
jgi:uncharacterized membrane protein